MKNILFVCITFFVVSASIAQENKYYYYADQKIFLKEDSSVTLIKLKSSDNISDLLRAYFNSNDIESIDSLSGNIIIKYSLKRTNANLYTLLKSNAYILYIGSKLT